MPVRARRARTRARPRGRHRRRRLRGAGVAARARGGRRRDRAAAAPLRVRGRGRPRRSSGSPRRSRSSCAALPSWRPARWPRSSARWTTPASRAPPRSPIPPRPSRRSRRTSWRRVPRTSRPTRAARAHPPGWRWRRPWPASRAVAASRRCRRASRGRRGGAPAACAARRARRSSCRSSSRRSTRRPSACAGASRRCTTRRTSRTRSSSSTTARRRRASRRRSTAACAPRAGRYCVVMNDDVETLDGWWPPLREALSRPSAPAAAVFPQTIDGAVRLDFAAWCFAISRDTLERFAVAPGEFFDPELVVWYQDTDLLERLRRGGPPAGARAGVAHPPRAVGDRRQRRRDAARVDRGAGRPRPRRLRAQARRRRRRGRSLDQASSRLNLRGAGAESQDAGRSNGPKEGAGDSYTQSSFKEKTNVPSHPEQRRGPHCAPQPERHLRQDRQVDGASLQRLPHQPRGRRRRRPLDLRAHAFADQRSRPGEPQHPGRRLDGADGGGEPRRGPLHAPARP